MLRRPKISHGTLVAYLALFVALGGSSAYAAASIGSEDIIDGQVKNVDLGAESVGNSKISAGSVTSTKIFNGTIANADLAPDAVSGSKVAPNSLTGADIAEASIGRVPSAFRAPLEGHLIEWDTDQSAVSPTYPDTIVTANALCPEGTVAVGSGYDLDGVASGSGAVTPEPLAHTISVVLYDGGVEVSARTDPGSDAEWAGQHLYLTAHAACARAASVGRR